MRSIYNGVSGKVKLGSAFALAIGLMLGACGKKESDEGGSKASGAKHEIEEKHEAETASKGVGPIQSIEVGALDQTLVAKGEKVFSGTCSACHKWDARYVGPALAGVTKRRAPEWIMNMILNPSGMTASDPTAKALLGEYMTQMSVNVTPEDARAVLEYFRKSDSK